MTRKEEYAQLLHELEQTPDALDGTVARALKKERQTKRTRAGLVSLAGFAACFALFVALVNLSVPFARACGTVPVLRELAKAVAWSPSLSAAVENEYVQPVGQSQTKDGITATVEYLIVDRKQVNIFYTLTSQTHAQLEADGKITLPENDEGYFSGSSSYGVPNGELRSVRVDFIERNVPDTVQLTLSVWQQPEERTPSDEVCSAENEFETSTSEQEYLAQFTFTLEFDPYYTVQGKLIPVDKTFTMAGQTFTLTEVELYPTHLRLQLEDDAANSMWLAGLELYVENEHGERFYASTNGITASGDTDGEGLGTFWLDSPFFSSGQQLTLCITRVKWRYKNGSEVYLDLRNNSAENLPDGVQFLGAEERSNGWVVSFSAPFETDHMMYSLFQTAYDTDGEEHPITQTSGTFGVKDPVTGKRTDTETRFTECFPLENFYGDEIYLKPVFSCVTDLDVPLSISILPTP